LSKIIRFVQEAPTVFIGGKQFDLEREAEAETSLARFCPTAAIRTSPDGCKLIPILEVFKIEQAFEAERRKACREGYEKGHEEGLQEGLAEAQKVAAQLEKAIADAVNQRASLLEEARLKILELVMQISRKVTFDAVAADPETTPALINGVIDTLVDRSRLTIKVNPDHLPIVEQNIERFLSGSAAIKEIKIKPDTRVRYGGCFIETPSGDIDARLESQFKVVDETIMIDEGRS